MRSRQSSKAALLTCLSMRVASLCRPHLVLEPAPCPELFAVAPLVLPLEPAPGACRPPGLFGPLGRAEPPPPLCAGPDWLLFVAVGNFRLWAAATRVFARGPCGIRVGLRPAVGAQIRISVICVFRSSTRDILCCLLTIPPLSASSPAVCPPAKGRSAPSCPIR